ncbi:hypothetical protein QO200_16560, partial [Flavobacterium sp. Arc3]|uniref:hypothetical protein n=1 Tax=Flavobacterium sp. Arc3 TaxID=3046686 RepID=UPI00352F0082
VVFIENGGGQFAPELGGHFELESGGYFKLELGGQYHWNLHFIAPLFTKNKKTAFSRYCGSKSFDSIFES